MTITARYPSKCATCGGSIQAGEQIEWAKGAPVRHADCAARQAAPPVTPVTPVTPTTLRVQYLAGHGSVGAIWIDTADRTDEFLARAAQRNHVSTDEIRARLSAGDEVKYGTDWDDLLRCGNLADARRAELDARDAAAPRPRFTCPICGDHRDTTIAGRCDDCGEG